MNVVTVECERRMARRSCQIAHDDHESSRGSEWVWNQGKAGVENWKMQRKLENGSDKYDLA